MRFCLDSKDLSEGVFSVIKALPLRTSMPVLDGIHIVADEKGVLLQCSDLMMQKECRLPASVDEEGECVVKGKIFSEVVRKLPEETAFLSLDGMTLTMRCGRSVNQLQCMDFDEFPQMLFDGEDPFTVSVDGKSFKELIEKTAFAVAQDDSRPVLSGVLVEMEDNTLSLVATDSYQFAKNTLHVEGTLEKRNLIIPGKTIMEIGRMMDESEEKASLTFSRTHMKADMGKTLLVARLLDGNYIEYRRIMPKDCKTRVLADRATLMESVDRAQLVAREGNNSILFKIGGDTLQVKAESVVGKIEDELPAQVMGDPLEIAFNPKFVLNVMKNIEEEKVYMEFNSPINPCVLKPVEGDAYFYLIVPMRIF